MKTGHLRADFLSKARYRPEAGCWPGALDRKRTFWRTETALLGADGVPLVTASIVFRGGADYSAHQMEYFHPRTPPEIFRRMFPNQCVGNISTLRHPSPPSWPPSP